MKKEEDVHLMLIYEIHSEEVCIHTEVCAVEISVANGGLFTTICTWNDCLSQ